MTSTLLRPEALAVIGTTESGTVKILARDFQRWAAAAGDRNPLYFDAAYAKAHGHRDVVMPRLFLSVRLDNVTHPDEMRPDGTLQSMDQGMPLPERRMAGLDKWEFHADAYPGDTIKWRRELVGLDEKQGRSGPFILITWVTTFTRTDGGLVAINTNTLLALPGKVE